MGKKKKKDLIKNYGGIRKIKRFVQMYTSANYEQMLITMNNEQKTSNRHTVTENNHISRPAKPPEFTICSLD